MVGFEAQCAGRDAVYDGVTRGHEGAERGPGGGGLCGGVEEGDAVFGEGVDGGGQVAFGPVASEAVGAECVNRDDEDVVPGGASRRPQKHQGRDKDGDGGESEEGDGEKDGPSMRHRVLPGARFK